MSKAQHRMRGGPRRRSVRWPKASRTASLGLSTALHPSTPRGLTSQTTTQRLTVCASASDVAVWHSLQLKGIRRTKKPPCPVHLTQCDPAAVRRSLTANAGLRRLGQDWKTGSVSLGSRTACEASEHVPYPVVACLGLASRPARQQRERERAVSPGWPRGTRTSGRHPILRLLSMLL